MTETTPPEAKPTVLVVDDSPEMLDLMKEVLGAEYKVRVAISGEVALRLAAQAVPDIVLLDVMMPEMDGHEVCRRLKQDPKLADVPVVFITAMDEEDDEARGFEVGAVDYITKPVSPPLVRARVATHVRLNRQRRELDEARIKAEDGARAKAKFLAMMSHEIRTPLSAMLGMLRLLNETRMDAEQAGYVSTVSHSGEALLAILNDVLDLAKLDAGKLAIETIAFDLGHTLDSVVSLMAYRAREKGVALHLEMAPGLPSMVQGDSLRLRQVLLNLIGNAIKFTEQGRITVRVEATATPGVYGFTVADTGVGIEEAALPNLFSDFTQQDASISRRFGGTGLGLSICRRLVALMGGDIQVSSTMGEGSVFRFRLPLATAELAPEPAGADLDSQPAERQPLNILVAEDDPVNQRLATVVLTHRGHGVTVVSDGAAAVDAVAAGAFDVVLMDVRMPNLDGPEATRRIRELPGPASRVPVIALTAGLFDDEQERCFAAGMNELVAKPFTRASLVEALKRVTGA